MGVAVCPYVPLEGHIHRPPPFDLKLPKETGYRGKGCVSWTQRPQETGHSHMSQENTLSTGSVAAAAAAKEEEEAAGKPPI